MSTQTKFDLDGLSYAVGARDARYQLALYADDAEVEIVDPEHPATPLRVLRGKSDIREWLDGMSSVAVRYRVTDAEAHQHDLRFTEQCLYPDGTDLRYECQAEVYRGQITRASVALVCHPRREPEHGQGSVAVDADGHPSERRRGTADGTSGGRVGRRVQPSTRSLPGNFLG